jgi:hypothetical protein
MGIDIIDYNIDRSDYSIASSTLNLLLTRSKTTLDLVFLTYIDIEFRDIIQSTSGVMLREYLLTIIISYFYLPSYYFRNY